MSRRRASFLFVLLVTLAASLGDAFLKVPSYRARGGRIFAATKEGTKIEELRKIREEIVKAAERGETYAGPTAVGNLAVTAASTSKPNLEVEPYWDMSNIPNQTFKTKDPHTGKIISVKRIVGADAVGEICEIVIDHGGKMPYWEGQSYGIIPPGISDKTGKPHNPRLYSIASTRYGDDGTGTTTTFTVRRATYYDPDLKREDPAKKGVCSNYLCDSKPGDKVSLIGPSGKIMLMPEKDPKTDIIMVATGTGIAPFRSFIRRLFVEDTPAARNFKGIAWLFLGVAGKPNLLYDADWQKIKEKNPKHFRVDYALSREQTNKKGGKMYIQDKVEEYSDEIFERMDKGAHMYFCGLKGMMPGILEMLENVCKSKGLNWEEKFKYWKEQGQWHVEVY